MQDFFQVVCRRSLACFTTCVTGAQFTSHVYDGLPPNFSTAFWILGKDALYNWAEGNGYVWLELVMAVSETAQDFSFQAPGASAHELLRHPIDGCTQKCRPQQGRDAAGVECSAAECQVKGDLLLTRS